MDQLVCIEGRTWAGSNRPGGVGRIVNIHYTEGFAESIDVKYVVGGMSDTRVDLQFVKPHEDLGRQSRSRRGREFFKASPAKRTRDDDAVDPQSQQQTTRDRKMHRQTIKAKSQPKPAPKSTVKSTVMPTVKPEPVVAEDSDEPTLQSENAPSDLPRMILCNEDPGATVSPLHLDETFEKMGFLTRGTGPKKALYHGYSNQTVNHTQKQKLKPSQNSEHISTTTEVIVREMIRDNVCPTLKEARRRTDLQAAIKEAKLASIGVQDEMYDLDCNVGTASNIMKVLAKKRTNVSTSIKSNKVARVGDAGMNDENDEVSQRSQQSSSSPIAITKKRPVAIGSTLFSPSLQIKKRLKRRPLPTKKDSPVRRMLDTSGETPTISCIKAATTSRNPLQELHRNEINRADDFIRKVVGIQHPTKAISNVSDSLVGKDSLWVKPIPFTPLVDDR